MLLIYFIYTSLETINNSIKITDDIWTGGNFNQLMEFINLNLIEWLELNFFLGILAGQKIS